MTNTATQVQALLQAMRKIGTSKGDARGLPNAAYQDESLYKLERDNVVGGSWAAIAYRSTLSGPGYAVPVELMGVPLLIVMDRSEELRVFHNVCSHRGTQLVSESTKLRASIRCPYHSWAYDFNGDLLSTPHIGGMNKHSCTGFDKQQHGLKPVRFAVWMDIIFVNLSGDADSFEDYIAPLKARWSELLGCKSEHQLGPATTGSNLKLRIACNWKLAVENYCEAYHLPWVHPELNSYSPLDQHFNIVDGDGMSGQGTNVYELASMVEPRLPLIDGWPADKVRNAEYVSLYPNILLGLQADHFFSVIVLPKGTHDCVEELQISYVGDARSDDAFAPARSAVLDSWAKVFKEDIFAVEGMQAGRNSPEFDGGVLTPIQDIPTRHFHNWVAKRYCSELEKNTK
ncbi:MAG: aromatic ring-hydroxylating oxygenase subunit alpha [Woeseiaceae bacterium]